MELNAEQKAVVETLQENILLTASAGTGKTNTMAARISRIVGEGLAKAEEILCLTFTNKACKEMRERISFLLSNPDGPDTILIGVSGADMGEESAGGFYIVMVTGNASFPQTVELLPADDAVGSAEVNGECAVHFFIGSNGHIKLLAL